MLSKFILSRFREVGRSNDQTKNNGWYRRKYLRGGSSINACKHCKQLRQRFRSRHRFSTFLASACVTLSRRRSFFLFHPFLPSTFFHASWIGIDSSKSGSDSSDDACDRASRSRTGVCAPLVIL